MEVHHYDGIVLFTGGIAAVPPMFGRRMTSRENKFEIFCVGDFGEIESGYSKEVNRQEKGPEVAQPAGIFRLRTLHYYPCDVFQSKGDQPVAPTSFCLLCVLCALCGQTFLTHLSTCCSREKSTS